MPSPTPSTTPTPTPTPTPTQAHGGWPTADGQPGDIDWTKLVPDFIVGIPSNDNRCDWWVNSDPEGEVCLQNMC